MKNSETEILNQIHQAADMGRQSLVHIAELTKDKELKAALESKIGAYKTTYYISEEMLNDRNADKVDGAKSSSVFMAKIMTDLKHMKDPSSSELADMVIQGSTMGITKLTKLLNSYSGSDSEVISFAQKEIDSEQENIENMKKFL